MKSDIRSSVLGIDIGGANLKLADDKGESLSITFPMWTDHPSLGLRIQDMMRELSRRTARRYDKLAVTMTGEMADCFETRREGVNVILHHVGSAFSEGHCWVYGVGGTWLSLDEARQNPWIVAASNWYALAEWIVRSPDFRQEDFELILDIGSTTVDVLPVSKSGIAVTSKTDRQRLQARQLVYTGVGRTAVAAILSRVTIDGALCPLVAERFATSDDAYLVLRLVPERETDCDTADGRPRTIHCARARLARMIAEDVETISVVTIEDIARQIVDTQAVIIAEAIAGNIQQREEGGAPGILVAGHGNSLAREVQQHLPFPTRFVWLDQLISPSASRCAPAVAVAWLLAHQK